MRRIMRAENSTSVALPSYGGRRPTPEPEQVEPRRLAPRLDRNGRGAAGHQPDAFGRGIEGDPDGHPLGEPDPCEGRVDAGEEIGAGRALAVLDTTREALDMARQRG